MQVGTEPYRGVASGYARPPGYPYVSGPLSDVFPLALPAWPACWSVAWEPERVQASPCQACPTFPKGKGPAEERGGAHWTQSFPPAPPTFRTPRPIPRGPAPTKKTPTVPPNPSCCNSFKQSRREIRRAAGTCSAITDEHSNEPPFPSSPVGRPVCQRDETPVQNQKPKSRSKSSWGEVVKSTQHHQNGRATPPAQGTDSEHRPQTKKPTLGIPRSLAYRDLNSPHTHTHHTQITSAVSLISAWPRPRHHCHLIRFRLDPTRLQPPWRGHRNHLTSPTCL